jgi:hypothetical protein
MTDELKMIWKQAAVAYWRYRGTCLAVVRVIMRNYNERLYQEKPSLLLNKHDWLHVLLNRFVAYNLNRKTWDKYVTSPLRTQKYLLLILLILLIRI